MITVTPTFEAACNSDTLSYREYININDTEIDIRGSMSNTCYYKGNFIGTFNLKMLKFETENDVEFKKQEFTYHKEVNGEAIKIGSYIVTSVVDNDSTETVKITAVDYGIKFANEYVSNLDYDGGAVTLFDVLEECTDSCGVALSNTSIENGSFIVDSNQFSQGATFGDVVSQVAAMSGNFATINEDDELELLFTTTTSEIIEDYVDLDDKRDTLPITSVQLGLENIDGENVSLQDDALIALYGEHWLVINDCPFAYTEAKRTELITAIFNKVKGFGYSSFVSKYAFKPYMQLGDLVQFKNKDGDLVDSIILKIDTNYEDITLSAPSVIDATVEYEQPLSAIDYAKNTQIIVDKQEQTITSVIESVSDQSEQITAVNQSLSEVIISVEENKYYTNEDDEQALISSGLASLELDVSGLELSVSSSGGSNLITNPVGLQDAEVTTDAYGWTGACGAYTNTDIQNNTFGKSALYLQNGTRSQTIQVPNGEYTISYLYKEIIGLADCSIEINGVSADLTATDWTVGSYTFTVTANQIEINLISDTNDSCYISDLMLNTGDIAQPYSANATELITDNVKIGDGIEISSNVSNTIWKADTDGTRIYSKDDLVTPKTEFTDKGTVTEEIEAGKGEIGGILIEEHTVGASNQTWISKL